MAKEVEWKTVAVAVVAVLLIAWFAPNLFSLPGTGGLPGVTTTQAGGVSVTKPIKFFIQDGLAGGGIGSASVAIYGADKTLKESITTGTDGTATTGGAYSSDTVLYVKISKSGYVSVWKTITVPKMTQADAQSLAAIPITLSTVRLTDWAIKVRDNLGNTYANNANVNKTAGGAPGTSVFTLFIDVIMSSDNYGWVDSFDYINNQNWKLVLEVKVTGTNYDKVLVTSGGYTARVERASSTYYLFVLSPDEVTRHKVGNSILKEGLAVRSIGLDLSSYTGDLADMVISLVAYADDTKFVSTGTYGPDALATVGNPDSLTLNLVD
ncbi:MAG: hypothetical protein QXI99_07935 [Candidatus Caldarchaeum sp.]